MKHRQLSKFLKFSLILLPIAFLFVGCATGATGTTAPGGTSTNAAGGSTPLVLGRSALPSIIGTPIASVAQTLQERLFGSRANVYSPSDPVWKDAYNYWVQTCHNADGSLCDEAKSGSLQCVEFVTGVYGAAKDPLPAIGNGNQFWGLYANRAGWKEIPNGTMPFNGDIAAWDGGQYGHVAIVVGAMPPQTGKNGYVRVAEANAPGTLFPGSAQPGNFYTMTWTQNGVQTWPGYTLQGFIHQTSGAAAIPTDLQSFVTSSASTIAASLGGSNTSSTSTNGATAGVSLPNSSSALLGAAAAGLGLNLSATQQVWATMATQAATHFLVPAGPFLKQINQESGFQPGALSNAGATGIAQFLPSTAAGIPRCVIDLNNAPNCAATTNGVAAGKGIDPNNPQEALPGAAYYMSQLYAHYLTMSTGYTDQDRNMAYARALAAYNSGQGTVDNAVASCGTTWLNCIDQQQSKNETVDYHETRDYVQIILGCAVVQAAGATCDQKIGN